MEKIFIIDASGYLYSSYFAIRNLTNRNGESTNALYGFIRSILKLIKDFHPTHIVAVFDGPHNAKKREELYSEYKAHRTAVPQDLPYQINWAQEFCSLMGIPYLVIPEVEADDTMGAVAVWALEKYGATSYLCTTDKDLCQLVNDKILLMNTRKDNLITGPAEVEKNFGVPPKLMVDLLAMTGDPSDNIPGLPGIGPKTAAAFLKEFGSLENLLENPEKVAEKKRNIIIENADKARLSKKLVTIDLSVPIPESEDFYRLKLADLPHLTAFYSRMSFNTLIKELDAATPSQTALEQKPKEDEVLHYTLVDDENSFQELIKYLQKQKEICFDTETTDIYPIRADLVGIGFGIEPHHAWYVPVNGNLGLDFVLKGLKPLFENPQIHFYGHNIKYDYHVLSNYGINLASIGFDTIIASYLLNSHSRQHSLDALSLEYFGKVKISIGSLLGKGKSALKTMREVPIDKVCTYCCEDVDFTCRLKSILEKQIEERGLKQLFYDIELPLLKVLAKMERQGIYLDIPCIEKMAHEIDHKIGLVKQQIFNFAGEEFNLNSPKQLSHILQHKLHITLPKKTATGFSTNADILENLKDQYPIAEAILEYRTLEKLRTTYIENLPHEVNPKTQRIHCNFNQSVTATGRLSCQDPNLQNIPVRTELGRKIREAFRPQKKGWSYLAADYSQIELRFLAHFSEDPTLVEAFIKNADIHVATAATIFNVSIENVTKEQRYLAKAVNFGMIYGQQAYGLARELKIDVKTASKFIETYFNLYTKVKIYIEQSKSLARQTGKAVTYLGRERLIPEILSKNVQLRMLAERLAINTPLQGTAADLIKMAMLSIDKKISEMDLKGYLVLQIHDELIFEVPDEEIEDFKSMVQETMQSVFKLKIPLIVDITIGKNWKEC